MTSSEYWSKREAEQLKHNITEEKEYDAQVKRIYSNMLDACQTEINAFYGKYAAKEGITLAEAKKRVSELDIKAYERKAAKYVKEKNFSAKANEEMRLYNATMKINRLEMLKANIGAELISGHDELEKFMGGILQGRTEDELKRQAGILGKTIKNNAAKAHAIVNGSFHSGTFSDRIWQYQDLMREDLGRVLTDGLIRGKNPRAIAKDMRKVFYGGDPKKVGGYRYCIERLMRTELARVQTEAQKQSFERNGFEQYEFIVNSGCCDICEGLKGKHFPVAKMMPGTNAPPMHPHCRCSTAAYSDRKEYEEWLDFLDKGGTTEEYNRMKAKKVNSVSTSGAAKSGILNVPSDSATTKFNRKTQLTDYTDDLTKVNPNWSTNAYEWTHNCQRSAPTYEMRRRGFNVTAKPRPRGNDHLANAPWDAWKNPKPMPFKGKSDIEAAMAKMGDGVRVQIKMVFKSSGTGHTFVAEQQNGKTIFLDPQTGKECSEYFSDKATSNGWNNLFWRIDNLEPSDLIEDCCE